MSVVEFLLRVLSELKPLLPCMATAIVLTVVVLVFLLLYSRNIRVDSRRFRLAGLFFGLNGRCSLRLACAWLKLIFMLVFVLGFQKLSLLHYLMLLIPGVLSALCAGGIGRGISSLLWLALQTVGLLSVNLICGYIRDLSGTAGFFLIYAAMGLFLILFIVYLFLNEVNSISVQRDAAASQVWMRDGE